MTATTSSRRIPGGDGAPSTTGRPAGSSSSGRARQTTSPSDDVSTTPIPESRSTSATAEAPGSATTGRPDATSRQPAGPSSPGRRGFTVTTTATTTGSALEDLDDPVLGEVDRAVVLQLAVARVDRDVEVLAHLLDQRLRGLVDLGLGLLLQLRLELVERRRW